MGGRAADSPLLVARGQASSQGWRQINSTKSDFQIPMTFSMLANFAKTDMILVSGTWRRLPFQLFIFLRSLIEFKTLEVDIQGFET